MICFVIFITRSKLLYNGQIRVQFITIHKERELLPEIFDHWSSVISFLNAAEAFN